MSTITPESTSSIPGTLYVVGTPIGNLEDMSFRAIRTLQTVSLIAAEDTRHTGKLLHHFQITTPQLSYHQHNHQSRISQLLQHLQQGQAIALVTDAGMPGISDPGCELVQACIAAEIPVVPIPGPCAAVTALSAAGLATDQFLFIGFLPKKGSSRRQQLVALQSESRTTVLYESPHHLRQTLADLAATCGIERSLVLARELTKLHETFWRGTIGGAIAHYQHQDPRGEYTLVLGGAPVSQAVLSDDAIQAELSALLNQGLSRSAASRQLAAQTSLPRRHLYQLALGLPLPESAD